MKTIETKLFSYSELSPEAKERVIADRIASAEKDECLLEYTLEECRESLKSVAEACGFRLTDWSFGTYCRNWKATIQGSNDELSGPRALAHFLRVMIENGYTRPRHFRDMEFPGVCGFTGVCFDDDVCETVWRELMDGETYAVSFDRVAKRFCDIAEDECAYLTSREAILECLDETAEIYTEDGSEF